MSEPAEPIAGLLPPPPEADREGEPSLEAKKLIVGCMEARQIEEIAQDFGKRLDNFGVLRTVRIECGYNGFGYQLRLVIPFHKNKTFTGATEDVLIDLPSDLSMEALRRLETDLPEDYYNLTTPAIAEYEMGLSQADEDSSIGVVNSSADQAPTLRVPPEQVEECRQKFLRKRYELFKGLVENSPEKRIRVYVEDTLMAQPDFTEVQCIERLGEVVIESGHDNPLRVTHQLDVGVEKEESLISDKQREYRDRPRSFRTREAKIEWMRANQDLIRNPHTRLISKTVPVCFYLHPSGSLSHDQQSLDEATKQMAEPLIMKHVSGLEEQEREQRIREIVADLSTDPFTFEYGPYNPDIIYSDYPLELADLWGNHDYLGGKRRIVVEAMDSAAFESWKSNRRREELLYAHW